MKLTKAINASALDQAIQDAARLRVLQTGGDALKLSLEKDFGGWLKSCGTSKAPLTQFADIEPLTDLITDTKIRFNLVRAIVDYGRTGKLLPPPPPPTPSKAN